MLKKIINALGGKRIAICKGHRLHPTGEFTGPGFEING